MSTRLFLIQCGGLALFGLASCGNVDYRAHRDLQRRWTAEAGGVSQPISALRGTYENRSIGDFGLWSVLGGDGGYYDAFVRLEPIGSNRLRVTLLGNGQELGTREATLRQRRGYWTRGKTNNMGGIPLIAWGSHDSKRYLRLDEDRNIEVAASSSGSFSTVFDSMTYGDTLRNRALYQRVGD